VADQGGVRGFTMTAWMEFKTTILPWVVAAAFIALAQLNHLREVRTLEEANARLTSVIGEMREELRATNHLLSTQGYTLPPTSAGASQ